MFNLLPIQERKTIHKEYNSRRIVLVLNFLNLTGLIAMVLLVAPFFLVNLKYKVSQEEMKNLEVETPELKNTGNLEPLASKTVEKLKLLQELPALSPLSVWEKIVINKSEHIKIKSFSYLNESTGINVFVRGTADSREALTTFSRSIESEASFKNVDLPVSSLTRDKDLDFSISFSVQEDD